MHFSTLFFLLFGVWRQSIWAEPWYPTELFTCCTMLMLLIWGCEVKRGSEILTLASNLMWELMVSRQWQIHHGCHNIICLQECFHMDQYICKHFMAPFFKDSSWRSSYYAMMLCRLLVFKGYLLFGSSFCKFKNIMVLLILSLPESMSVKHFRNIVCITS